MIVGGFRVCILAGKHFYEWARELLFHGLERSLLCLGTLVDHRPFFSKVGFGSRSCFDELDEGDNENPGLVGSEY